MFGQMHRLLNASIDWIAAMDTLRSPITIDHLLSALRYDEGYIFLGPSLITVGILAGALCFLPRRFNVLLFWLALFAILDGLRLWLQSQTLALIVGPSVALDRLSSAINYIVPLPAFLFFRASGLLSRALVRSAYGICIILIVLFSCTLIFGPRPAFYVVDSVGMSGALIALIVQSLKNRIDDKDILPIRIGLVSYAGLVVCAYIGGLVHHQVRLEPLGFVVLLVSLGYVAARRTFQRDEQLNEIERELEIATRIQLSILPESFPRSKSFTVAARYLPMTSVAGDFYDFILSEDQRAGLLIADASGHGVPAALIASMVKLAGSLQRIHAAEPARLLHEMNVALCGNTQTQFVTAAYVYLDATIGELRYSAAAHPPMLLLRNGKVTAIAENGLMLALFPFAKYSTVVHSLCPGDRLLLYTDGIVEAFNSRGEEFGHDNLCALLHQSSDLPPEETADRIMSSIRKWAPVQDDDLTLLICDYTDDGSLPRPPVGTDAIV
jgi:sigma-B regulation protein RsbU (phosphoserine phosphatase)